MLTIIIDLQVKRVFIELYSLSKPIVMVLEYSYDTVSLYYAWLA